MKGNKGLVEFVEKRLKFWINLIEVKLLVKSDAFQKEFFVSVDHKHTFMDFGYCHLTHDLIIIVVIPL